MCSWRNSRFVTKWWTYFRRFQVAREKNTQIITTSKFIEFGVGITTAKGEIEEKALRTPLRSSSTGDSLLVEFWMCWCENAFFDERIFAYDSKRLMNRDILFFTYFDESFRKIKIIFFLSQGSVKFPKLN